MFTWQTNIPNPIWVYPNADPDIVEEIIKEFKIHPVIAQILAARGKKTVEEVHDFLYAKLPDLHDPYMLNEMARAAERTCEAIERKENILIYGDNDVDGMTGTALLTEFFRFVGANVFFYLTNRSTTRQSLIVEALEYAKANECKLLITVDCGITAATEIAQVVGEGVDVIVTDHHEPTANLPHCVATLNPKLINSTYPNRELTGVGVAFKLAHGITKKLVAEGIIPEKKIDLKRYLDLVALGTISDMGSLECGENRILVRYGLHQLKNKSKRIGLMKLISVCGLDSHEINAFDIASKIAPRLNSLGRIDDPEKGVQLLLVRNTQTAEKLAIELDLNNLERQKIEKMMSQDIEIAINENPNVVKSKAIIMESDKWHPGIIAILATRISKLYNRPAIMLAIENGFGKGSLRSIHEFPLLPALKECADLFLNFGGHDYAAGLTIKQDNIPEFRRRFIQIAEKKLSEQDVQIKLQLDAEMHFKDLTFDFLESLNLLEPFGNENPPPVLYSKVKQAWPPKVLGPHLKLYLVQEEQNRMIEGIALWRGESSRLLRKKDLVLEIAYIPQQNDQSIHLFIKDFRIIGAEHQNLGQS